MLRCRAARTTSHVDRSALSNDTPTHIELRSERTEYRDDFVFLAPDVVDNLKHLHGHWWRRDETHIHALWTYDLGGVAFDLETTKVGYTGTAVYYCDICTTNDKVAVDLVRVPCSPHYRTMGRRAEW